MRLFFNSRPAVPFSRLFDGSLLPFGVREEVCEHTSPTRGFLTDGKNYLWVTPYYDAAFFEERHPNRARKIIEAAAKAYSVKVFCELDPWFWGFDTAEEWAWSFSDYDAELFDGCQPEFRVSWAQSKTAENLKTYFYENVMRYVRGGANEQPPGSVVMCELEIGRALIEANPDLALPENKDRLWDALESAYERDYRGPLPKA